MPRWHFGVVILLCCVLFLAQPVLGQSTNATLSGRIADPSGGSVPAAKVSAENVNTGVSYSTETNDAGFYEIAVPPGKYRVIVWKDGFARVVKPDVELHVQDQVGLNFALQVGSVQQSVTVEGGAPLVNTESVAVGVVTNRQFVENIPLNGRSFQSLIEQTPGVVVVPVAIANSSGQFSINGQRSSANSFMVDGVSANVGATATTAALLQTTGNLPALTALGTTHSLVSIDALQEFRVQTSNFSAEYGRQPGGQISMLTRSGTNQFHGSLYEFLRNDAVDGNDWFSNSTGQPKPAERQNDFGGTLGGPLTIPRLYDGHDRTFFFFSYEGLRLRQPQYSLGNVPTLALRQQAPAALQPILNAFPLANGRDLGNGLAELNATYSDPATIDAASIRIDHTVNSKLTLFGRYVWSPSQTNMRRTNAGSAGSIQALASTQISSLVNRAGTVGATALLTPWLTNDFRFNYTDDGATSSIPMDSFDGAMPVPQSLLVLPQYNAPGVQSFVELLFPGRTTIYAPGIQFINGWVASQRQLNVVDSLAYSTGSHRIKLGVDYRRLTPLFSENPYRFTAVFNTQAQVLNATAATGTVYASIPLQPLITNFSVFVQDSWKVSRRVTLDLGLRWDVNPAPSESGGHLPLAVDQVSNLATMQLAPRGTPMWPTTYKNFAPRIGVAYQASQRSGWETVVRGGFGVFYDTGNDLGGSAVTNYPYTVTQALTNIAFPLSLAQVAPPPIAGLQPALSTPYGTVFAFDPHLKLPYTLQWNVAVEQSFGKDQALSLTYVGNAGRRLLQLTLASIAAFNRNFTTVEVTRNSATSDYDALQVLFQRRMARGLQARASYTWSHALDYDSSSYTGQVAQRGDATFDIRHNFYTAFTYEVPATHITAALDPLLNHWALDGSFHAQSAAPVDIIASTLISPVDGSFLSVRPNLVPGVPLYVSDPHVPGGRSINRAAFTVPPAGQSGDFGRNVARAFPTWEPDIALVRDFPISERIKLQFRAESFNFVNHPNFGAIQTTLSAANFGQATNMLNRQLGGISQLYQIGGPRSCQFALKLLF